MNEDIDGYGTTTAFSATPQPYHEWSKADWTNQYYGQYLHDKLQIDSEYRRYWRYQENYSGIGIVQTDVRGTYVAGSYRLTKWFQAGSYYSRYSIWAAFAFPAFGVPLTPSTGHTYDKVVSGRFDLNRFVNIKVEGHFMNGIGLPGFYPDGFYNAVNPQGLKPNTNALVVKTGFNF
jgi:hypothetical protein